MSGTLWTGELLVYAVLIVASLPARLSAMRASLWLDEAWVANSILSPSWKEMFYYPRWLQPTPALFLALTRLLTKVLGPSEAALRFLPVLAAVAAIPVLAIALRKLFGPAAALCGTSLVIVNFWAVKYAQQVKQFGADVFASALLVFLITRYCDRPDRRNFTLLVAGFVVMPFLSTTAFLLLTAYYLLKTAREPLILYERGGTIRRVIDGWFRRGGARPHVVMELGNEEAIKKLVGAGLGISVSPAMAVRDEVRSGALSSRPLAPPLVRRLGLVRRRDKPETPALSMFRSAVESLGGVSENRARGRSPAGGAAGRGARRART